jgi:hemoglobin
MSTETTIESKDHELLSKIGGEEQVEKIVIKWYEFLVKDDMVSKYFLHHNTDLEKLQKMQKKFLVHILNGAPRITKFTRRSMRNAHSKLRLQDKHFDRVKELLGKTILSLQISPDLVKRILELAETTRNDILGREEPMKPAELFEKIGGEKMIDTAYRPLMIELTFFMIRLRKTLYFILSSRKET